MKDKYRRLVVLGLSGVIILILGLARFVKLVVRDNNKCVEISMLKDVMTDASYITVDSYGQNLINRRIDSNGFNDKVTNLLCQIECSKPGIKSVAVGMIRFCNEAKTKRGYITLLERPRFQCNIEIKAYALQFQALSVELYDFLWNCCNVGMEEDSH